MKEMFF